MATKMLRWEMLLTFCVLLCVSSTSAATVVAFRGETAVLPCDAFLNIRSNVDPSTVIVTWEADPSQQIVNSTFPRNDRYTLGTESDNSLLVHNVDPGTDNRTFRCMAQGIANREPLATTSEGMTVGITQATLTTAEDLINSNATVAATVTSSPTVASSTTPLSSNATSLASNATTLASNVSEVILNVKEPNLPGQPRASQIGSTSLVLSWLPSNGPVANYSVSVSRGNTSIAWMMAYTQPKNASSSVTVLGLLPFDFYYFQVRAHFTTGYYKDSPISRIVMTAPGRPSQPPRNVTVSSRGPTTIAVSWQPPSRESINGILVGYRVMVSPGSEVIPLGHTTLSTVIEMRKPYTKYTVSVAVVNNAVETERQGPYSPTVSTTTDEAVPGPPYNLQLVGQMMDTLIVFWRKPNNENGRILFYYAYIRKKGDYEWQRYKAVSEQQHHLFNGLDIFTEYDIKASASTSAGEGRNSSTLHATTDVAAPSEPRNITIKVIAEDSVFVSWLEPLTFYNSIDSYTISYRQVNVTNSTMKMVETNTSRVIRGLKKKTSYELTVRASSKSIVHNSETIYMGDSSNPERFLVSFVETGTTPYVTSSPPGNPGTVIGVVFALFILLALTLGGLAAVVLRMRKKDHMSFEKHGNGIPPTFCRPDDLEEPAIHISKFESHVIANHANSDGGFAAEYEEIQRVPTSFPALNSADPANKPKNRYTNIVAYDSSRVTLQLQPGVPNSDYINANYIDGFNRQKAYIATQGAMKTTFDDFWRLVWEQRSVVIVMITKLEERGRRKCDRYWPSKGRPERYNEIEVTLEMKEKFASYTLRTFLLKHKHKKHGKIPERRVYHFHYTDWPDHGVPPYTLPVLSFIQRSSAANPPDAGPIIVHCSAGVGRTGTYIVIDTMLKQMQVEEKVNVFGFLKRIRTQRNYLVQTEEQYVFIHDVLLEWLRAGNTVVKTNELRQYVDRMTLPDEVGKIVLDEQFNLIMKQKTRDYEFAKARQNKHRNRSMDLIPVERSRVPISGSPGADGYINASFLQGYRRQNEYIVTQYPMEDTIMDFWRMVWEHNSTTIVTLTEKEQEDEPIYWPTTKDEPLTFGFLTVTLCEEEHSNISFITREFLVQSSQDDDQLIVRQYHCSYWPECCSPIHTAFDLIYAVEKRSEFLERSNKDTEGPITVHDRNGGSQAGTFCALSTLHQELIRDEAVDIYKTIKLYAAKRPGIIPTKDEYSFLFRALQGCYAAEQQIRSLRRQGSRRGPLDGNRPSHEWNFMRNPGTTMEVGNLQLSDSMRNSSLESDGFYRTRSQTMASVGPNRHMRPSKFWHRRTKSEKRKPTTSGSTNLSSLATTPGDRTPSESNGEVYELINVRSRDSQPNTPTSDMEFVLVNNDAGSASGEPLVAPEIHVTSAELQNGEASDHADDSIAHQQDAAYRLLTQECDDDREGLGDDDGDDDIAASQLEMEEDDMAMLNMNGEIVNLNLNGAIDLFTGEHKMDIDFGELNGEVTPLDLPIGIKGRLREGHRNFHSEESVNSAREDDPCI